MDTVREFIEKAVAEKCDEITVEITFIRNMVLSGSPRKEIVEELDKLEEALA